MKVACSGRLRRTYPPGSATTRRLELLAADRSRNNGGMDRHLAVGLQPRALGATVGFAPENRHPGPWLGVVGLDDCEGEHRPLVPDEAGVRRGADRSAVVVADRVVLPCRIGRPGELDVEARKLVGLHVRLDDASNVR